MLVDAFPLTPALSLLEREPVIQSRSNNAGRVEAARTAILSLLGERAGVRGYAC